MVTDGKAQCCASNGHKLISDAHKHAAAGWEAWVEASSSGWIWCSFQMRVGFGRDKNQSMNQLSRVILLFAITHKPQNFHSNASAALQGRLQWQVCRYCTGVNWKWKKKKWDRCGELGWEIGIFYFNLATSWKMNRFWFQRFWVLKSTIDQQLTINLKHKQMV